MKNETHIHNLTHYLTETIKQTNGINLQDTVELMLSSDLPVKDAAVARLVTDFRKQLANFQMDQSDIKILLEHPFAQALYRFFRRFPLPYREEHIHLTGSLASDFIYDRLMARLDGPHGDALRKQIELVYGPESLPIRSPEDIDRLIRLQEGERFDRYLKILILPKLILTDREAHRDAAYHMAHELYHRYNVGNIRLKFTLSRATSEKDEMIPGIEALTPDDIALGLYEGFNAFRDEHPEFEFILSPCFRKEPDFYDARRFSGKREHMEEQIRGILDMLDRYPFLRPHLREVDTVGNERGFYRKAHFQDLRNGFRKLQCHGFQIRSHHGETWNTLRHGIQAVDNAMNIWHINTLEHGLSLGINPNYYYHSLYQRILRVNAEGGAVAPGSMEFHEINDMLWDDNDQVREKLINGIRLNESEKTLFTKAKFHTAREVEHYQHDVLNRMIHKKVSLMSLPSSNYKLTSCFDDYKDHPFSWWEKKGVKLGVGTDNYITLNTDFIREMLILLFTDPVGLKITKLLMVTTGETRRPYISHLLWKMPLDPLK